MNVRRLQIYLDDHLALIAGEIALIGRCWWKNRGSALGDFLQRLENEVRGQRAVARDVLHRLGGKNAWEGKLKQGAALVAERMGRFKLNDSWFAYSDLSRLVELETLCAAAQERVALWDSLAAISTDEGPWEGISLTHFRDQSQKHLDELQSRRRFAAAEAFVGRS